MKYNFHPFPELKTERLRLRSLSLDDTAALFELRSHRSVKAFLPRSGPENHEATAEKIRTILKNEENGESVFWVICRPDNPAVMGTICIWNLEPGNRRGELGYEMFPDHHGKGFMTEALQAVLKYGFGSMKLHSVCAMTDAENQASIRLLEKAGFEKEGHFREAVFYNDRFHDQVVYTKWE
jgi:ribosomal-protein-alanine N-acetyltransferase